MNPASVNLATEPEAADLPAPQALPQAPLGARRIASQASRISCQLVRNGATPHPDPAPNKGGGNLLATGRETPLSPRTDPSASLADAVVDAVVFFLNLAIERDGPDAWERRA